MLKLVLRMFILRSCVFVRGWFIAFFLHSDTGSPTRQLVIRRRGSVCVRFVLQYDTLVFSPRDEFLNVSLPKDTRTITRSHRR
jgi:hypothetical protein